MELEKAIVLHLQQNLALKKMVDKKIYAGGVAPEGTKAPYLVFSALYISRHHDLDVAYPVYQFSCFSPSYAEAKQLGRLVRQAFWRYKGDLQGVQIIQGVLENEFEIYEEDTKLYHVAVEIKLLHQSF